MASTRGRSEVIPLTNKSGGSVAAGDVVVIDTANDTAFTTTTTGRSEVSLGVAQETIANNSTGRVLVSGYAALVNVPASVTRGHYIETHTVAKQATGSSTRRSGSFGQFLTGGATPTAWLWGSTDQAAAAGASTNIIVDIATPIKRTGGNITANSTTWTELAAETGGPGTGGFDLDFTGVSAGDILEVSLSYYANNAATYFYVDFATIVSSSPVNYIGSGQVTSSTGDGVSGMAAITGREETKAGTVRYAVVSGDLSAGALKIRPYFRTSSATDRTIFAVTADPFHLSGIVFRP